MELQPDVEDNSATHNNIDTTEINYTRHERRHSWRLKVLAYTVFVLVGQISATLLARLYFNKGGNTKFLAALVQFVGFPLLFPFAIIRNPSPVNPTTTTTNDTSISTPKLLSFYVFLGLLLGTDSTFYTFGLSNLPLSTFSLISSSQLGFNAVFAIFFDSQKLTFQVMNSVVLLTISSTLLVFHHDSKSSNEGNYAAGCACTLCGSAVYALMLSLTQLFFKNKKSNVKSILDVVICQSFVATLLVVALVFASGEWTGLAREMGEFELGKMEYCLVLAGIAICWQVFTVGSVGLTLEVSSLFSNVVSTLGLPIVPIFAVIFFHDEMNGLKVIALVLAIWGFVSYALHQKLYESKNVADGHSETPSP